MKLNVQNRQPKSTTATKARQLKGSTPTLGQAFSQTVTPKATTVTQNGDTSYVSAGTALLDFVSKASAMRNASEAQILSLFQAAYNENRNIAIALLFNVRDIPNRSKAGGQGERNVFYTCFKWLIQHQPLIAYKVLHLIPEYGSWKDVKELMRLAWSIDSELIALTFAINHMTAIVDGDVLAAKYALDQNDSNIKFFNWYLKKFTVTRTEYRKMLNKVRKNVVERKMSDRDWFNINYEQVPSQAAMIYRKAFNRHDPDGYQRFMASVTKGEKKINAGTLNPVQLLHSVLGSYKEDATLDAQWNALSDFIGETAKNALVMADVSGSMRGQPLEVAISLAMYIAERAKGQFNNKFMTFSESPQIVEIKGNTFRQKVTNINDANWDMNTDFRNALAEILKIGTQFNVPNADMPDVLLVISDMQFDTATRGTNSSFTDAKAMYKASGYTMPHIVFWNVNAREGQPADMNDDVTLVSGYSPSLMITVFKHIFGTSKDIIEVILETGRYDAVVRALE